MATTAAAKAAATKVAAASAATTGTTTTTAAKIRKVYRELLYIAKQQKPTEQINKLRTEFRQPIDGETTNTTIIESRLKQAQDKLAFLKISSSGIKFRKNEVPETRYVYKDGERLENVNGTYRNDKGRVVSPYDGKNLDPESVTKHRKNLRRAGFVNNAHAKGIF